MSVFSPLSIQPVFSQWQYVVGAKVYVYDAGTSEPRTAYSDGSNTPSARTHPFLTDSNGFIPPFWVSGTASYRVRVLTAAGVQLLDIDHLPGETATNSGSGTPDTGYDLTTGDWLFTLATAERAGFVKANGKTLGSASSGADYASDDYQALYVHLYTVDAFLAVTPSRGTSALADFQAAKPLTLPTAQGRVPTGLSGMGNTNTGILFNVPFSVGSNDAAGSLGGEPLHTLLLGEAPQHNHTGTTLAGGGGTITGTTDAGGVHNHTGTTDSGGTHHHFYTAPQPQTIGAGATLATINSNAATLSTTDDGVHTHTFTTANSASHTHTFTSNPQAQHQHFVTVSTAGADGPHNNMPPFILGTWFIKT